MKNVIISNPETCMKWVNTVIRALSIFDTSRYQCDMALEQLHTSLVPYCETVETRSSLYELLGLDPNDGCVVNMAKLFDQCYLAMNAVEDYISTGEFSKESKRCAEMALEAYSAYYFRWLEVTPVPAEYRDSVSA